MADMTTHLMLDCVNVAAVAPFAASADALAGYINGNYQSWPGLVAAYGSSGKYLLSIDVLNLPSAGAQCLDIETGDASIADAPGWFKATQAAGIATNDFRYYPKLYTSAGNVQTLINTMTQAGVARNEYMIWSAHYTGTPHICGPSVCGYPQADATQYTDLYQGANVDGSLCFGYFFAGPPDVPPVLDVAPVIVAYDTPPAPSVTPYASCNIGLPGSANASSTTTYHVQIADMSGNVVYDDRIQGGSIQGVDLKPATKYQCRYAAGADDGHYASQWSPYTIFNS